MTQIKYFGPVNSNGVPQGYGRLLYPPEDVRREYVGNFFNGRRHGYGILQWKDGCVYAGEWASDTQNGWGKLRFGERDVLNRESYEGEWLDGKRSGKGILYYRSGDRYEGEWKDDKYHGKGEFVWYGESGSMKYKYHYIGEWVDGRRREDVGSFKVTPMGQQTADGQVNSESGQTKKRKKGDLEGSPKSEVTFTGIESLTPLEKEDSVSTESSQIDTVSCSPEGSNAISVTFEEGDPIPPPAESPEPEEVSQGLSSTPSSDAPGELDLELDFFKDFLNEENKEPQQQFVEFHFQQFQGIDFL